MLVLGIESTAHTFGVSIIDSNNKKVLSNIIDSYTTKKGGMIPSKVAEHHVNVLDEVIKKALKKSKINLKNLDIISFSQGPGIGNMLRVGSFCARTLSFFLKIPLVGVNHCIAHLEIGKMLTNSKDPVLLYASGANTQIIAYDGGKYRIFGETLDIGIGNLLDALARTMDLGFPGGPKIYELAKQSKNFIELPYTVKGMDVSFGGLLTNLKSKLIKGYKKEDLAFSVQETIYAMLVEVVERALAHTEKTELLLGGGVACNKRLQKMAKDMCVKRNVKCYILPDEFNADNAAMIAWLGYLKFKSSNPINIKNTNILPYQRTDEVKVSWY